MSHRPWAPTLAALTSLGVACGGGNADGTVDDPTDVGDPADASADADAAMIIDARGADAAPTDAANPDAAPVRGTRFDDVATTWTTPNPGGPYGYLATQLAFNETGYSSTFDIDGDRRPDLVSTTPVGSGTQHGGATPHWLVYRNLGDSFAAEPVTWATPNPGTTHAFFAPAAVTSEGVWATVDLNGDSFADFVWTAPEADGFWLGFPDGDGVIWKVYLGSADGFAAEPLDWHAPFASVGAPAGRTLAAAIEQLYGIWELCDLDGDGLLDLVSTATPNLAESGFLQHGEPADPHWRVYRNLGDSFDATPVEWPTPPPTNGSSFIALRNDTFNMWSTFDLDGDDRPDLVTTGSNAGQHGAPAAPHWLMYRNDGAGFAIAPTMWPTPSTGEALGYVVANPSEQPWTTTDLDGDGLQDLVSLAAADLVQHGLVDAPHWLVYRNLGAAFDTTPLEWATPDAGTAYGFPLARYSYASLGFWDIIDLDGDRRTDFVWTGPVGTTQFGLPDAPHWRVFRNVP